MEAVGGIVFLLVLLAASVVWVVALIDAVRAPEDGFRRGSRLLWVLVIALTHLIGAVLYVTLGRQRRPALA